MLEDILPKPMRVQKSMNKKVIHVIMILWRFVTYYFGMIVGAVAVNIKEGEKKCE